MTRTLRTLTGSNSSSTATAAAPPSTEPVNMESQLVVLLAALLCALICMLGLITVTRCTWHRRRSSNGAARSPSQASANKGIKKKNLQMLPKFTYTSTPTTAAAAAVDIQSKFASSECAICLGEFVEGDELRVLPQCGHGFHVGCIDTWLGSHSSCPSCRQILVVDGCQKCGSGQFPDGGAGAWAFKAGQDINHNSYNTNHSHYRNHDDASFLP